MFEPGTLTIIHYSTGTFYCDFKISEDYFLTFQNLVVNQRLYISKKRIDLYKNLLNTIIADNISIPVTVVHINSAGSRGLSNDDL